MTFDLETGLDLLTRTPTVLDALLRGLDDTWSRTNEGPETWSAFDVVGHLIHGEETDWIPRAQIILKFGSERPFEPFDRFAQFERFAGWSLGALLDELARLRRANLETLRTWNLQPADLERMGTHPALGAVSLGQLLATWVVHDLGHIAQIARVLAKWPGGDVGPWRAYLGVLGERERG
jgi:hypothetical protein